MWQLLIAVIAAKRITISVASSEPLNTAAITRGTPPAIGGRLLTTVVISAVVLRTTIRHAQHPPPACQHPDGIAVPSRGLTRGWRVDPSCLSARCGNAAAARSRQSSVAPHCALRDG